MCIFIDDDGLTRAVFVITTANFQSADWALCQSMKDAVMDGIYQDSRQGTQSAWLEGVWREVVPAPSHYRRFHLISFSSDDANSFRL